jgi:hypothetical protein
MRATPASTETDGEPQRPRAPGWGRGIALRIGTLWPLKMVGTMAWIAAFFWLYFWIMRNPAPGTTALPMPVTAIDRLVDVHEWAVVPYASLWIYVAVAPALARDRGELLAYAISAAWLCAAGLLCFWAFPTAVPSFAIDWHDYPALSFMKARDGGTNAFPSLHVAFAVHSAAFIRQALRGVGAPRGAQLANAAWAVIIVWSVIATRQHVFVDVLGGIVAGLAALAVARQAAVRLVVRAR